MNPTSTHNKNTPKLKKILGVACLAVLSAASTQAATWLGGTMSYNTPGNWSGGQVPTSSLPDADHAINNAGLASVVQVNPGDPDWVLGNRDILLGNSAGTSGSYMQNGPTVTLNFWFRMGTTAGAGGYADVRAGTLNVGGQLNISEAEGIPSIFESTNTGIVNVGGELWVGNNVNANGTLNLAGTSRLTVNNWFAIGRGGSVGVVNLSGNASITKTGGGNIEFANNGVSTATLNQTGGAITNETSETQLGANGTGTWNMTNGVASLGLLRFGSAAGNGTFNLVGGTLMVNQINVGGGSGTLNFNGGTLMARGSSVNFMSGASAVIQAGGAKIDSQGFNITIASAIGEEGGGGTLTKIGSGELALTGPNTYTGPTVVNAGKLLVNEATTPNGSYTVAGGGTLSTGPSTANGQFNVASLTAAASSSLDFDLRDFGNPTTAPLNVTGALTVNGAVTVNVASALPQLGQFPLIKYGSRSGSGTFVLGSVPIGMTATIVTNVGGSIDLNVTAVTAPRWNGQVNGIWDTTTANWIELSTSLPTTYANGNAVLFNDSASGTTSVTLGVTVTPGRVTVNNTNLSYSLSGSGKISGLTSLLKQGAGSLALNTTNDYTGVTRLEGGTLSVTQLANGGAASAIGSSSASAANLVFGGGTLSYSGPALTTDRGYTINSGSSTLDAQSDMTFNGAINAIANGNFAKSGNGTLFVKRTGANTLSAGGGGGAYNIVNGKVVLDGSAGAQTNTINGELWTGGATNTTSASLVLTNTTLNVSSWLSVGRGTGTGGATSSVALYNSKLRSGNGSLSYDNGIPGSLLTGQLTLNGTSTYTNSGDGNFGESSGGMAVITLNDSSIFHNNNRMQLGWHTGDSGPGTGVLTVANSAKIVVNAWMSIGNEGGDGRVIVKDNGSLRCTDLNICDVNTGNCDLLAQDNAALSCDTFFVGKGIGSVGTNTIRNNATVTVANGTYIGATIGGQVNPAAGSGTGTINLSGGSLSTTLVKGQADGGVNESISTVNFNGGKLIASSGGNDFVFNLTAANVLAGGAVIEINTTAVRSIPQPLVDGGGGGGLTKLGTGTLLLNGVNTYTGNTLVSAGTLGGNGAIAGNVTVQSGGTISAGDSTGIGQLTIGGNLAIAGNVAVEVNTSLIPSNDVIAVTGTLTKTGAGILTVANLGPSLLVGDKFFVFNKAVAGGALLTVSGAGANWQNNLAVDGSITVTSLVPPVPTFNPASVATLPDGNKSVTATGTVGSTYKLWATTNVALTPITTTWTLLSSGIITTSPFTINDLSATNFPRRFYIFSAP